MTVDTTTGKQGSGRTLAWVTALDANKPQTLVVHTNAMGGYLRRMLQDVRPDIAHWRIVVVSCQSDCDRLRGAPFDVDHAVWEAESLTPETKELLRLFYRMQRR